MKSVIKGRYKANVGAGAETFWKSEPEPHLKIYVKKIKQITVILERDREITLNGLNGLWLDRPWLGKGVPAIFKKTPLLLVL